MLKSGLANFNYRNLLHIAVVGPRVNQKFFSLICEERSTTDTCLPKLLNAGSCNLHIVHVAFCIGIQTTGWCFESSLVSVL